MTVRLAETTARLFEPDGALARTVPGFEPRPGQSEMAMAVAETLEAGGVLLAEAGTGTGKTLAYLAPAILGRQRVLVSTGTKNLQEQIFFKDLPLLRDALGIPFAAVCMKGRGNYLCLHRFESFRRDPLSRALVDPHELSVLSAWAARHPDRRPGRGRKPARGSPLLGRYRGHLRGVPGLDVSSPPGLLHHPDAAARQRGRSRHREPPPAVRGCLGAPEHLR